MNKFILFLLAGVLGVSSCSDESDKAIEESDPAAAEAIDFDKEVFTFDAASLIEGCSAGSEMVCAINLFVKCSIDPQRPECLKNKDRLPSFVFMSDESLERPTHVSYRISRLKPLPGSNVEVYTQSRCNGKWFGLCNGHIIYVMSPAGSDWNVQDVYALQTDAI